MRKSRSESDDPKFQHDKIKIIHATDDQAQ